MAAELVILLHGILKSSRHMRPIEKALTKAGFQVLNIDYPSRKGKIQDHVEHIHLQIKEQIENADVVHFVGYSMGGLIVRGLLHKYKPKNLGRVVLLAAPNRGSEWADTLQIWPLYHWLYGPAGQQLTTTADLENILGSVDYPCGVIAGSYAFNPLSCFVLGDQLHDNTVSVASTKVAGMTAHKVVKASHLFFPDSKDVQQQTVAFLKTGNFTDTPN